MKLYKYICGDYEKYGVAEDEVDAYAKREQVDQTFHYLPITIEEVKVEGYEISIKPEVDNGNKRSARGKEAPNG